MWLKHLNAQLQETVKQKFVDGAIIKHFREVSAQLSILLTRLLLIDLISGREIFC